MNKSNLLILWLILARILYSIFCFKVMICSRDLVLSSNLNTVRDDNNKAHSFLGMSSVYLFEHDLPPFNI